MKNYQVAKIDHKIIIAKKKSKHSRSPWMITNLEALKNLIIQEEGGLRRSLKRISGLSMGSFCKIIQNNKTLRKLINNRNNFSRKLKKDLIPINSNGYIYGSSKRNGKRMLKHREIVEDDIGRVLKKREVVHHIDLDKNNNDIENLYICPSQKEHCNLHKQLDEIVQHLIKNKIIIFYEGLYQYVPNKS